MILPLLTIVVALLTALVVKRRLFPHENTAFGWLVVLVLFEVFILIPIHIVAGAEISGLIDGVSFSLILGVGCVILLAAFALPKTLNIGAGEIRAGGGGLSESIHLPKYLVMLIVLVSASGLIFIVNAIVSYSFGWDSLSYHLPLALSWIQKQSLAIPVSGAWQYSMPANGDVGLMVMLAAGLERIAFAPNLLAYTILAISVYLLGRRLTEDPVAALLAVILFATVPIVQFQATSAYIDLFGTAFILAGAALFAYRDPMADSHAETRRYVAIIALTGLAWGIAVGTKPIFYAYGGLFCIGALFIIWRERRGRAWLPVALGALLVGAMLVPSAFWFLRALDATGNPIFPIPVHILGTTIFEGHAIDSITRGNPEHRFVTSTLGWFVYPWVEYKNNGYSFGVTSGLGAAWATFVPLGIVFAAYFSVRNANRNQAWHCAVMLMLLIIMSIMWWFALRRFPRFGLPVLATSCILATPLFAFLLERRAAALKSLFTLSLATSLTLSTFVPTHELMGKLRSGAWSRNAAFEIPDIFDRVPAGSVIWNAGAWETWNFALAGDRLSNRVVFRRCWRVPDYAAFVARHRIDYVVEFLPYRCGEVQNLGARRVFEGQIGPSHKWRVWAVSAKAKAAAN